MEKDSITHSIIYYYLLIDFAPRVVKLAAVTDVGISYNRIQVSELLHAGLIRAVYLVVTYLEFLEEGCQLGVCGLSGSAS